MTLKAVDLFDQLDAWERHATDPRGAVPTGFPELDEMLRRGGLTPGTITVLAGYTGSRKTATLVNMMYRQLTAGFAVGFLTLDEPLPSYVAKLASAMTGVDGEAVEDDWFGELGDFARLAYKKVGEKMTMSAGVRPELHDLDNWLRMANHRPAVVYIDYLSLVYRERYDGNEAQRIPRAAENLQQWKNKHGDFALVVLHQSNRGEDGRYDGSTPGTLSHLKYGSEEIADLVFFNYRPARDSIAKMPPEMAKRVLGDKFDEDDYSERKKLAKRYSNSTLLQFLKNRVGNKIHGEGEYEDQYFVELISQGLSQKMVTKAIEDSGEEVAQEEVLA